MFSLFFEGFSLSVNQSHAAERVRHTCRQRIVSFDLPRVKIKEFYWTKGSYPQKKKKTVFFFFFFFLLPQFRGFSPLRKPIEMRPAKLSV